MSKVIQIRDVPDDIHEAITLAAHQQGQSLTSYLKVELAHLARKAAMAQHNTEVIRRTQSLVGGRVDRAAIRAAVREERGEE